MTKAERNEKAHTWLSKEYESSDAWWIDTEDHVQSLETLLESVETARDFEWWQELICVDSVDATPQAAKKWQVDLTDYAITQRDEEWKRAMDKVIPKGFSTWHVEILRLMGVERKEKPYSDD